MTENIFSKVRNQAPYVHNITNYVTANDCANMLLACGASPIMADDPAEAGEISACCNSLVINIGTLSERTIPSMLAAGRRANELGIPVILDPVGVGASRLRTQTVFHLMEEIRFSVIRGNASEIGTLCRGNGKMKGVDASEIDQITEDNLKQAIKLVQELGKRTGAVIAVTGKIDIVVDSNKAIIIRNGHPMMSQITGTGCMLSSVVGALCATEPEHIFEACVAGVSAMGICGELAYEKVTERKEGTGSYRIYLIDAMSRMEDSMLLQRCRIEEINENK
jgi:hydroxyethylthiazole kinase